MHAVCVAQAGRRETREDDKVRTRRDCSTALSPAAHMPVSEALSIPGPHAYSSQARNGTTLLNYLLRAQLTVFPAHLVLPQSTNLEVRRSKGSHTILSSRLELQRMSQNLPASEIERTETAREEDSWKEDLY